MIDIKVPSPGESITEVQIATWLVNDGDFVEKDQDIVEIDSDKATLSIASPEDGKIKIQAAEGDTVEVNSVIASIDTSVQGSTPKKEEAKVEQVKKPVQKEEKKEIVAETKIAEKESVQIPEDSMLNISPLAKKLMLENNVSEADFIQFLKGFRVGKKDVDFYLSEKGTQTSATASPTSWGGTRETERKKMSTLRLKLAERLVSVKNETAMLTTFNEVNMTPIMEIRKKYKEIFKEKHGVSLGFMSFFTKAVTEALNIVPGVNARIDGNEIVYHNYADIGIAVSSPKGLMVPVLRNAERMSLAEIELNIKELATKARNNKITIDEMTGGTFTITNGGVFGSMLSTPILNPPQSAILGMHNIVERPIALDGKVEIHPIMYVALSYDHRIIDGRESVTFLVNVKEMLENPVKMLFAGKEPVEGLLNL
ncbi:MAG: 2-oxoglutarate dehydrogenase complex dihydrolipoyllysine-residue succinyltransferase [Bacteroidales bacterium]|nr:2-oxoglutarate dehydrogenase complex dihydrolipoyllysine-residue succinyltransferase [Bacteroidales bacterium]MCF8403043.1 2-oxoglutarate dehydrogenase complex dihydrolipoyllysine-residue succinyltransferase [Bacteroidales bacterium]